MMRSPSQARGPSEQGETMSLIAALESLPSLLASPLASLAFRYTLASPEGARPVLGACAAGPALAMLLLRSGGFHRRIESANLESPNDELSEWSALVRFGVKETADPHASDQVFTGGGAPHIQGK